MARKYAIRNENSLYFVTFTVVHWLDVFTRNNYKQIFLDSLQYCQKNKELEVYSWCIMTNHVHLILRGSDTFPLSGIIRDLKSFTSRGIRKELELSRKESRKSWMLPIFYRSGEKNSNNRDFQLWQQHNHPIELNTNFLMEQRMNYIHNNPVKAGFVDLPEEWIYSSARDYCGYKGLIDISFIQ